MIKLWGRTNSSNVMKVMWLLDELGVAHERIDAGGAFGRTDTPEYRAMSPLGQVPALEDGAVRLFESNAILRYLARTYGAGRGLYPDGAAAAGLVDAWLDFQQTALAGPQGAVFVRAARTPPGERDPAAIAQAIAAATPVWALLDAQVAAREWIAGPSLSLADMAFGPHLHRWFAMLIERPELPALRAWYGRMTALPAYARTCMVPPG